MPRPAVSTAGRSTAGPSASAARRRTPRTLGVLLALAVAVTAGAPAVITIRPGDTLWDLARKHNTTVAELMKLNALPGHGTIYAGRTLQVPTAGPSAGQGERTHVVRRGDTLSEIALAYGVDARELAGRNSLRGTTVQIGRRLTIPGAGPAGGLAGVPRTNAGVSIPEGVRRSAAEHRATLAQRQHPSKAEVRRMIARTARKHRVSPSLAVAVAYHESGFQQRVVSGVDAIGVMQVLPSTGRVLSRQHGRSLDLLDAQDNITAGVLLLRQLSRTSATSDMVLAGYYQGVGSISRRGLLPQTHDYIRNVNRLRERFPEG